MATDDLTRLLAYIDDLLPPGAPSDAHDPDLSDDAMRWSPTDHDDHPDTAPPDRHVRRYADLPPEYPITATATARLHRTPTNAIPAWIREALDNIDLAAAIHMPGWHTLHALYDEAGITAYLDGIRLPLQHDRTLQHPHPPAQAIIEARRHRNTGPSNPHGIDGRPRRTQRPRRAAAPHARPPDPQRRNTQHRGSGPAADAVWLDEPHGFTAGMLLRADGAPRWFPAVGVLLAGPAAAVAAAVAAERSAVIRRMTMQDGPG